MKSKLTRLLLVSVGTVALCVMALYLLLPVRAYSPPAANILPYKGDQSRPGRLRLLLVNFAAQFSKPNSVNFRADVFTAPELSPIALGKVLGRAPSADTNGTMLWFLSNVDVAKLEQFLNSVQKLELLSAPAISTSELGSGAIFVGQSIPINGVYVPAGLEVSFSPRHVGNMTRSTIDFLWTAAETNGLPGRRTNAAFSIQTKMRKDTVALILSQQGTDKPAIAVFVSPQPLKSVRR